MSNDRYQYRMIRMSKDMVHKRNDLLSALDIRSIHQLNVLIESKICNKFKGIDIENFSDTKQMISVDLDHSNRPLVYELKNKIGINFTQQYLNELIALMIENGILRP